MLVAHRQRHSVVLRRSRVLLGVTTAVALGAISLAAPSVGLGSGGLSRCFSSQLKLKLVSFQGATGHRFWQLAFKNVGSKCRLHGFPRVTLLNSAGHTISATIKHETGPVPTIIVGHGERGNFTFSYTAGGFCSNHFFASRLKVYPPRNAGGFVFNPVPANHGPIDVCVGSEEVSPIRAHPGG